MFRYFKICFSFFFEQVLSDQIFINFETVVDNKVFVLLIICCIIKESNKYVLPRRRIFSFELFAQQIFDRKC